jgi:hypothetical protein
MATTVKKIVVQPANKQMMLKEFVEFFRTNKNVELDSTRFVYKNTTKTNKDVSKVIINYPNKTCRVVDVTTNENRVNFSLLTVNDIEVITINDTDLANRVKEYNKTHKKNQIKFPISAPTFRNFSVISNGDFNVKTLPLIVNGSNLDLSMDDVSIFDGDVKSLSIKDFAKEIETVAKLKAKLTALNYWKKQTIGEKVKDDDERMLQYHIDAVPLLEEMGFDSKMRYAPKKEYVKTDETSDYNLFLEISGNIDKCSSFSAPKTIEKMTNGKSLTESERILEPTLKEFQTLRDTLKDDKKFLDVLESAIDSTELIKESIASSLVAKKFFLMSTNSWFDDSEKKDEIAVGNVVIKTKEVKEYV